MSNNSSLITHHSSLSPVVGIVLGSDSDLPVMEETVKVLRDFGVPFEVSVLSAHRSPRRAADYATTAEERGLQVIIAGAGMAAHLPGVLAACTCLPVIGVPLQGGALNGMDALYAIVQMPPGVPVATVAVNGARNAALLAVQMLSLGDAGLRRQLRAYKERMAADVAVKSASLQEKLQQQQK
ncbi:MAG: 5-(carboxyamino)imidazole ribonucleotide mutase [Thermacetogeniaceae bacterium]|jgi:5-(carboxyamino)imidazole ribonucleotide mutase